MTDRPSCVAPGNCAATGSGHCRKCRRIHLDNHPELRAKMSAARKKALADPAVRAKMSAARKKAMADPAVRAKMSAARKKAWADPAVRAKMSAARKKAWAVKMSWCPTELQDEYRFLVSKLGSAEARAIIERRVADATGGNP